MESLSEFEYKDDVRKRIISLEKKVDAIAAALQAIMAICICNSDDKKCTSEDGKLFAKLASDLSR